MSKEYWKEVLNTARKSLAELRERRDTLDAEREEVNLEIVQLEQVVSNLTPLVSEPPLENLPTYTLPSEIKLTDACREVLKKSNKHMTPIEIRNVLEASGYDLSQHANALASIHGVLKRLVESGEAEPLTHDIRGTMYRWIGAGTRVHGSTASSGVKPGMGHDPKPAYGPGGPEFGLGSLRQSGKGSRVLSPREPKEEKPASKNEKSGFEKLLDHAMGKKEEKE